MVSSWRQHPGVATGKVTAQIGPISGAVGKRPNLRSVVSRHPERYKPIRGTLAREERVGCQAGFVRWRVDVPESVIDDGKKTSFQLPYGEWIRLFRANGFVIEDLIEPRPGSLAASTYKSAEALAWARRWPAEAIWRVRK